MIMHDWRLNDGISLNVDARTWDVQAKEATPTSYRIEATCPDGTERQLWLEIQDGNLVVHAYDPEHEEPMNLRITMSDISVDTEREGQAPQVADRKRCDAMQEFVRQIATVSLPEEETTGDLDEFIADLDEERLFGEYHTFMDVVRSAREIVR
ncbi:hypothetical protein [Tianweitania sediminis]|uniref:Uncharacterized protein n=1 Tax=Tianweitania sediminis TaxID=1502156 RepID=A0A8J7RNR2_9HYPH|nr:hypothetical protein [Tianweitania sediminis]MBP0440451.1 hypothetical protein [Tianweitania sediminis]